MLEKPIIELGKKIDWYLAALKSWKKSKIIKNIGDKSSFFYYKGQLIEGKKHGYGEYGWSNGNYYYGLFLNDNKVSEAIGKLIFKNGREFRGYTQRFSYKFDYGLYKLENQDFVVSAYYVSNRKLCRYFNVGLSKFGNNIYDGYFSADSPSGFNISYNLEHNMLFFGYYSKNGFQDNIFTVYNGYYHYGKKDNINRFVATSKKLYINDYEVVFGRIDSLGYTGRCWQLRFNEFTFRGTFSKNLKNGYGLMKFFNGNLYEGNFIDDLFQGKGTLIDLDFGKYVGEFYKGLKHGHGRLTSKDGIKYIGNFNNDKLDGVVEVIDVHNTICIKCKYIKGEFSEIFSATYIANNTHYAFPFLEFGFATFFMVFSTDKENGYRGLVRLNYINGEKFVYFNNGEIEISNLKSLDYILNEYKNLN